MIDSDVSIMMSPSKLAAQRIYSPKRNIITFHAAMQSKSPDLAIATFERSAAAAAAMQDQNFHPSASNLLHEITAKKEQAFKIYQQEAQCVEPREDATLQKILQSNDQQFKIIQEQIDLLRKLVASYSQSQQNSTSTVLEKVEKPHEITRPVVIQSNAAIQSSQAIQPTATIQPTEIQKVQDLALEQKESISYESKVLQWLQKLFFAFVFLVGLVRIVSFMLSKIENLFSPSEKNNGRASWAE